MRLLLHSRTADKGVLSAVWSVAAGSSFSFGKEMLCGELFRAMPAFGGKTPSLPSPGHFLADKTRWELLHKVATVWAHCAEHPQQHQTLHLCSLRDQQKHMLLNLAGSFGEGEITASRELLLYDAGVWKPPVQRVGKCSYASASMAMLLWQPPRRGHALCACPGTGPSGRAGARALNKAQCVGLPSQSKHKPQCISKSTKV